MSGTMNGERWTVSRHNELWLITQCKLKFMSSRLDYPHATLNVAFRAKDKTEDRKKAAGKVPFAFPFALFSSVSLFAQNGQLKLRAKRARAATETETGRWRWKGEGTKTWAEKGKRTSGVRREAKSNAGKSLLKC